ncbi:MAG: ferredoxin--NADP reductase [Acidimicrobiia bacterium]
MDHDQNYYPLAVAAVVEETADTRSFVLGLPAEPAGAFAYEAGQFCTFRATIGGQEVVRCYSMSSTPQGGDTSLTVTVKRVPEGVMSNWMIDTLEAGATIEAMRPAGLFVLQEREPTAPIVAFGGGSGITPIFSIIEAALATTARPITLVYANRDADSVIFGARLRELVDAHPDRLTVHWHLDSESGFLTADDCVALVGDQPGADYYVCGPGPYMDVVESALAKIGVSPAHLHIERFVVPGEHVLEERSGTESVTIRLNGRKTTVDYRVGDTILDTARRGGLKPPFSCESGSCATCMAHLDEGSATMRVNNALRPDEVDDNWVLTCQAVPQSRTLTVDYDA